MFRPCLFALIVFGLAGPVHAQLLDVSTISGNWRPEDGSCRDKSTLFMLDRLLVFPDGEPVLGVTWDGAPDPGPGEASPPGEVSWITLIGADAGTYNDAVRAHDIRFVHDGGPRAHLETPESYIWLTRCPGTKTSFHIPPEAVAYVENLGYEIAAAPTPPPPAGPEEMVAKIGVDAGADPDAVAVTAMNTAGDADAMNQAVLTGTVPEWGEAQAVDTMADETTPPDDIAFETASNEAGAMEGGVIENAPVEAKTIRTENTETGIALAEAVTPSLKPQPQRSPDAVQAVDIHDPQVLAAAETMEDEDVPVVQTAISSATDETFAQLTTALAGAWYDADLEEHPRRGRSSCDAVTNIKPDLQGKGSFFFEPVSGMDFSDDKADIRVGEINGFGDNINLVERKVRLRMKEKAGSSFPVIMFDQGPIPSGDQEYRVYFDHRRVGDREQPIIELEQLSTGYKRAYARCLS